MHKSTGLCVLYKKEKEGSVIKKNASLYLEFII